MLRGSGSRIGLLEVRGSCKEIGVWVALYRWVCVYLHSDGVG